MRWTRGSFVMCVLFMSSLMAQSNHTEDAVKKEFVIGSANGRFKLSVGDSVVIETSSHLFFSGAIEEGTAGFLKLKIDQNVKTFDGDSIVAIEFTESATYASRRPRWPADPSRQRTLFLPTAQTLKRYEKAYENYYLFYNNIRWGVNYSFELNAGVSLFPSGKLAKGQIFTAGVKNKLYDENGSVQVTAGAQGMTLSEGDKSFTFVYLMTSIGNPDGMCFNFGAGNVFGLEERDTYMFLGSFQIRLNNRIKLLAEGMALKKQGQKKIGNHFVMGGLRYYAAKGIAVDAGYINGSDSDIFPNIPVVNFVYLWK